METNPTNLEVAYPKRGRGFKVLLGRCDGKRPAFEEKYREAITP